MRCPYCGHEDTQVRDSRAAEEGVAIRRRRGCSSCGGRFTTFERVQLRDITVVKNNGEKEPFDRDKLFRSMLVPLRKRPVAREKLDTAVTGIVRQMESIGENEIATKTIGEMAMNALANLDQVAYVRYASVYKDFHEVSDFNEFVDDIKSMVG